MVYEPESDAGTQRLGSTPTKGRMGSPNSSLMRKAKVLGFETRNVSNDWLQPLGLRNTGGTAPVSPTSTAGRSCASPNATSSTAFHHSTVRDFVQLSPHYGPGQNTPKELACLRTTRSLAQLGRTAIFSQNPYVDSALETLLPGGTHGYTMPAGGGSMGGSGGLGSPSASERRLSGRLPRRGAKAAAMQRARMQASQGAAFLSEVPFADAVRVCNLAGDKTAMPALLKAYIFDKPRLALSKLEYYADVLSMQPPLIQLQCVAQLLQFGYFFTSVKVVYSDHELLKATLEEMRLMVQQGKDDPDWEIAAHTWRWQDLDKELFVKQFSELRIIAYYLDVRQQLRANKQQGAVALARVEREMLTKVIDDFRAQVDTDLSAEREEKASLARAQQAIEDQRREAEEAKAAEKAQVMEEAKARAAAKARSQAEERKRAAEERARAYAEARRAAKEAAAEEEVAKAAAEAAMARLKSGAAVEGVDEAKLAGAAKALVLAAEEERQAAADVAAAAAASSQQQQALAPEASSAPQPQDEGSFGGFAAAPAAEQAPASPCIARTLPKPPAAKKTAAAAAAAAKPSSASTSAVAQQRALSRQASAAAATEVAAAAAADAAAVLALELTPEEAEARAVATAIVRQALTDAVAAVSASDDAGALAADAADRALGPAVGSRAGSRGASPAAAASRAAPAAAAASSSSSSRPASRLGSAPLGSGSLDPSLALAPVSGTPPAALLRSPLASRPGSMRGLLSDQPDMGLTAADLEGLMSPLDSRPGTAGSVAVGRETLDEGIAEMRRQLSEGRKLMDAAAEQLRASRPTTPLIAKAITTLTSDLQTAKDLSTSLEQQARSQEAGQDAERADMAVAALEKQQQKLESALSAKKELLEELAAEREKLTSSKSMRVASRPATPKDIQEDKRLSEVEVRLAAEEQAARQLAEQKAAVEAERVRLEAEKEELRAASKVAMNEQITRTMRMFQEQLAQTVKMAAMLQAQRIMTGGVGPSMATVAPTVNLPHEVDEPPTQEEIVEYARYLGMDPEADPDLLHIAEWALTAPVPEGWTVHLDGEGTEFFHNNVTNVSTYEHPMDEHYRKFYEQKRAEKAAGGVAAPP